MRRTYFTVLDNLGFLTARADNFALNHPRMVALATPTTALDGVAVLVLLDLLARPGWHTCQCHLVWM